MLHPEMSEKVRETYKQRHQDFSLKRIKKADLKFHCMMATGIFSMASMLEYPRHVDSSHHFGFC